MAYVPPALRRKHDTGVSKQNNTPTIREIQAYFWPTWKQQDLADDPKTSPNQIIEQEDHNVNQHDSKLHDTCQNSEDTSNTTDLRNLVGSRQYQTHSTLNACEEDPDKLKYVLLFPGAHPKWKTDQMIYVKSELRLLPQSSFSVEGVGPTQPQSSDIQSHLQDEASFPTHIMVFDHSPGSPDSKRFQFAGHYDLVSLQYLEPKSKELVAMLEDKWTRTNKSGKLKQIQRDPAGWKKSLAYRWAVLKFQMCEDLSNALEAPKIPVDTENLAGLSRRRGVNELLKDMRLEGEPRGPVGYSNG